MLPRSLKESKENFQFLKRDESTLPMTASIGAHLQVALVGVENDCLLFVVHLLELCYCMICNEGKLGLKALLW